MKKYLFMAIAAVTALAFSSCKDENNNPTTDDVTITFAKKTIELGVGEEVLLGYTVAPVGAEIQQLKFVSSDASVATVSASGRVTGVAEGEAQIIVSAEGAKGDTCTVIISDYAMYTNFEFLDYALFSGEEPEYIEGTDTIIKLRVGTCNAKLAVYSLVAWDGNVMFVSGHGWTGDGLIMQVDMPLYLIVAGDTTSANGLNGYIGYYISTGGFDIADIKGAGVNGYVPYVGQSGKIDVQNYGKGLNSLITAQSDEDVDAEALNAAFEGAYLYRRNMNDSANYWYRPYGVIDRLAINELEEGYDMGYDITWSDLTSEDRYYGLKCTLDEEGYITGIATPYDYATVGPFHYGNLSFEEKSEVRKPTIGDQSKVYRQPAPVNAHNIKFTDRLYKK